MNEIMVKKPYANIYEPKNLEQENENMLRIWCTQWPDVFSFQIRTYKPITDSFGKGKPRNMIATVSVTITEMEYILKKMKEEAGTATLINTKIELISSDES